ncbi:putative nucleoside triphosphate pyrophosphohydrolase [uncultured virus]|uniref:Putative nucleoside triphosphate pyrophosphohydrolase n=1 Tax=uncultured virus TaxID=340016 RepID=A0A218MMM4_9VIRU|nr:putative nucleoside triphosphate pyrophosphohydrolase [uncultured virus]
MTYYLYHIPGKKIGVTRDLKYRVEEQQGYNEGEYDVILSTDDIAIVSEAEISLQKAYGYKVDEIPYNKLKFNNMNINVTEQTTTFPCPVSKLKGQLMDNKDMKWETEHGSCIITDESIKWLIKNVQTSKYNTERCYVYNKAFARYFDNNDAHVTRTGGIMSDSRSNKKANQFDLIRKWARDRGLYKYGDPKTQSLKLVEEVGEICRATLKEDHDEVIDGIGDCVVVLTNLAELHGVSIEDCIASAYGVISKRTGKMVNGTFKKD